MAHELSITYAPAGGNGKVGITVKDGGDVLAMDKLDILSASARDRFAKSFCKARPGIDRAAIDAELLQIAGELQAAKDNGARREESSAELDVSRIIRPECFLTAEVCGLSVATPILSDGKPAGRWMLWSRDSLAAPDRRPGYRPSPGC